MSLSTGSVGKFLSGVRSIPRSARVLTQARLWPWVLAPGIFISLIPALIIAASILHFQDFSVWFHNWLPDWAQFAFFSALMASVLWLAMALGSFFLGSQLVMALYAPFFGLMSERIEAHMGGECGNPFTLAGFLGDIFRAIAVLAITLTKWLAWMLFAFLFSWIPVIGQITSIILFFIINGYFAATGGIDTCLERRGYSIGQTFKYCRRERFGLLGLGAIYQLLMLIPVLGWIIAPGLLVAGASVYCVDLED